MIDLLKSLQSKELKELKHYLEHFFTNVERSSQNRLTPPVSLFTPGPPLRCPTTADLTFWCERRRDSTMLSNEVCLLS